MKTSRRQIVASVTVRNSGRRSEFAFIQGAITQDSDAEGFARRILFSVCRPYSIDGKRISVGGSIGIALAPRHGLDPDVLMQRADAALYRSKLDGRGVFSIFA